MDLKWNGNLEKMEYSIKNGKFPFLNGIFHLLKIVIPFQIHLFSIFGDFPIFPFKGFWGQLKVQGGVWDSHESNTFVNVWS